MGLQTYKAKRRFGVTPEPRGRKARARGNAFVIQKHAATRLHYDLRLELDGVMLSWAITRGPSLVPGEKRLAVHVEDHPIEYNKFEGTIPQGEYGGGTVMIWDRGTWTPEGDPHRGYKKGHLDFALDGEKLQGGWHLVRMRRREGERQDPWLLIKASDEAARTPKQPDILEEKALSVASGRTMDEISAGKGRKAVWHSNRTPRQPAAKAAVTKPAPRPREPRARTAAKKTRSPAKKKRAGRVSDTLPLIEGARSASLPGFVSPCLTVLSEKAPDTPHWLHEIKFDGYRMQARLAGGEVQLKTRSNLDWTARFRPIADALRNLPVERALIDGEIVVEAGDGRSSFSALQEELKTGGSNFIYYAFDLLHLDGQDLQGAPLVARKEALQHLLAQMPEVGNIRLSEHFETEGSVLLAHACRLQLEGIISKLRDAPYRSGRGGDWLKTKCSDRQEFVVIGYAPSTHAAHAIGALILGYYRGETLQYAGRVGTGYTQKSARELWRRLSPLQTTGAPFRLLPAEERGRPGVWVEPRVVVEVDFRGWTHGMRLRHPSFKGVREDKRAMDVVREEPMVVPVADKATRPPKTSGAKIPRAKTPRAATRPRATPSKRAAKDGEVHLTHPDRVYWEDVGLTKQGLADYYAEIWDWIAPHVTARALSLVRCPEGAGKECFYQKHASAGLDGKRLRLVREDDDHVIAIDDLDGLLALVQAGVLEVHVRGGTVDRLDASNRLVFDLDPSPEVGWPEVVRAAREIRERLEGLGLETFLKTTGGKGLHVVVPIENTRWDQVKAFTRSVAEGMAADSPERYLAKASKQARTGRIFIDYLRNSREATAICAYSTRTRPGATVSVPIAWNELGTVKTPNHYTVGNLMARLRWLRRDPWADIARVKQRLPRGRR